MVKNPPAIAGDMGSIPRWERSPGQGNGSPLQCYYLGEFTDGGAWWAIVHEIAKSQTQLNDYHRHTHLGVTWKRKWPPTPIFLPGKPVCGYSPWGGKELNMT